MLDFIAQKKAHYFGTFKYLLVT
ncbi:hypothetical protein CULT_2440003 [[Clostridium] ultunense Esp]|nr:hypothetical protein CULT_2440003 [[Clostridium] ultunense Esp]